MSQDAPVTKVWRKSVNRYWRYRGNIKLPRESRTDGRTDGRPASAGAYRRRRLKNSVSFPHFSRAINLLFHRLSQQKVNVIMIFIKGLMILFNQSTAVLHKYLNDELKILCSLRFFPEVAQNSPSFPCSEKSPSIPDFPGLWPPCKIVLVVTMKRCAELLRVYIPYYFNHSLH